MPWSVATSRLRAELPLGYGTVAGRAALAAAEAEAEAAAVAAAAAKEAAAQARASAVTATRTPASTAAPSSAVAPASNGLPLGVDPGASDQVVTVVAASARSTTAQLTAWDEVPTAGPPCSGR